MGLDMYLNGEKYYWTIWEDQSKNLTEDGFKVKTKTIELGYWRKHPNLHGYLVETFAKGEDNCKPITLMKEDLITIMQAIKEKKLPSTSGFFFGQSDGTEVEEDLKIFEGALKWLDEREPNTSREVSYRASW